MEVPGLTNCSFAWLLLSPTCCCLSGIVSQLLLLVGLNWRKKAPSPGPLQHQRSNQFYKRANGANNNSHSRPPVFGLFLFLLRSWPAYYWIFIIIAFVSCPTNAISAFGQTHLQGKGSDAGIILNDAIPGRHSSACLALAPGGFCTTVCPRGYQEHELLSGCTSPYVCCLPINTAARTLSVTADRPTAATITKFSVTQPRRIRYNKATNKPGFLKKRTTKIQPDEIWQVFGFTPASQRATRQPTTTTTKRDVVGVTVAQTTDGNAKAKGSVSISPSQTGTTTVANKDDGTSKSRNDKLYDDEEEGVVYKDCSFLCKAIILTVMATIAITILVVTILGITGSLTRCC